MKVLFVNNNLGGLVKFRMDVMLHLQALGHEVVAVVPSSERDCENAEGIRSLHVPLHRTSVNLLRDLLFFFSLLRAFLREKPDYAFLYTIKPNIYGTLAARVCGIPSSMMMAGLGYAFSNDCLTSRIARRLYRVALKYSEHLLLLNEQDVEIVGGLGICKPEKLLFLQAGEGINLQRYQFHDNRSDKVRFLFVGRLMKEKGILDFVEAARLVKRQGQNVEFQIAGEVDKDAPGCLTSEEFARLASSGVVDYLGHIDVLKKLEEPGIVMVVPSYYSEGLNRSLMEGCAAGKPIITTNHSGCREAVVEGRNGYLIPARQPHVLAEAMLRYMSLPEEKKQNMSLESRRLAESRFDVRSVYGVYEGILSKH